jgi:hypothetical protein
LYFGKTTKSEKILLEKYNGSGIYWSRHLKMHGKDSVETIWYCLFTEEEELVKFALQCSSQWDIVNSNVDGKKIWANEKPENGLEGGGCIGRGGRKGRVQPPEEKAKQIAGQLGKVRGPRTEDDRKKISIGNKGKLAWNKGLTKDDPRVAAYAASKLGKPSLFKGIPRAKLTCPHCNKIGGAPQMNQWHFDNCKQKAN